MADGTRGDLDVEIGVSIARLAKGLAAAEARFLAATRKIEKDSNAATQRAADQMATNYSRGVDRANAQTERLNQSIGRMNGAFANSRGTIQNAAFQIGDFAVQVGAGTAASIALAQQLPQLLGGFGVFGAVAGAAVAILAPLATGLLRARDGAVSADDAIKDYSASLDAYKEFVRISTASTAELREEFGKWTEQVQGFAAFMASLEMAQSMEDLRAAIVPMGAEVRGIMEAMQDIEARRNAIAAARADVANGVGNQLVVMAMEDALALFEESAVRSADALGLAVYQAVILNDALEQLGAAQTMDETAAAAGRVLGYLESWFPAGAGANAQMRDLAGNVQKIFQEAAAATAVFEQWPDPIRDAAQAAGVLQSALGGSIGVANALASAVSSVAAAAWDAANGMAAAAHWREQNAGLGDDERGTQREARDSGRAYNTQVGINRANERLRQQLAANSGGGGGGGGGGAARNIAEEFGRLMSSLDPLIRASEEFEAAQQLINDALAAGATNAEEAARAYSLAEARFQAATDSLIEGRDAWTDLQEVGGSALDKLIEGTGNWRDVLIDAIRQFALARARSALLNSMPGADQNASLGTLLMQGIFGRRASGGPVSSGRPYVVGERGPEVFVPSAPGQIVPNSRAGASVDVRVVGGNLEMDDGGRMTARFRVIAAQAGNQAVQTVRQSLPGWNQQIQVDGAL